MQKLKTVLRSSHKKNGSTSPQSPRQSYDASEPGSPRADPHAMSPRDLVRSSIDPHQGRRSRPVSSHYNDRRASNASATHYVPTGVPASHTQSIPSESTKASVTNDYKSYLPALSPVDDLKGDSYMTLGGDKRLINEERDVPHEGVADRNIDRYGSSIDASRNKPLPAAPNSVIGLQDPRNGSSGGASSDPMASSVPSSTSIYPVGQNVTTKGGLVDSIRPHEEVSERTRNSWKQGGYPSQSARDESQLGWSRRRPQASESDDGQPQPPPEEYMTRRDTASQPIEESTRQDATVGGQPNRLPDWKVKQQSLLDGVVDLRNTVDTNKTVQIAAPVVHEVIKPHEHEIIQKKIYREIHNYSYYHRIQPVMHTEVLPPRHFIPNPNGEGLIEISADELPMRTGKNRWWEIVQKETPQTYEIQSRWRAEPEIIEQKPYITEEGLERRETTIIYPPRLEDMSNYDGIVQPVHFDHKTGERWLSEVTTMGKLKEQYNHDMLTMQELTESLPDVPASPTVKRKPVGV
ncbi:hypothetical protein ACN47E_002730 [Coniothyrium glycines]